MKNLKIILSFFILFVVVSCSSKKNLKSSKPNKVDKNYNTIAVTNKMAEKYATALKVKESTITNGNLYAFIDNWEGTPYQLGGLTKNGIDCSGFVHLLYKEVYNQNIPRVTGMQVAIIKRKYENEFVEGDLVFFDYDGRQFSHVGVYLQNGYYVHASTRKGVIIGRLKDPYTYKYFSRGGSIN